MMLNVQAREWIGTRWSAGQSKKGVSCDCVGLILGVANECGLSIRPENYSQVPHGDSLYRELDKYCTLVENVQDKKPGDVLVFKIRGLITHVGFLDEEDYLIHADMKRGVVRIPLGFWKRRVKRVYRL